MVVLTTALLLGGGLVVAGTLAAGFLAGQIGQALHAAGQNASFETTDEVSDALLRIGRPDLSSELLIAQAEANTAAFNIQGQSSSGGFGGIFNESDVELVKLGAIAFLALKVTKVI